MPILKSFSSPGNVPNPAPDGWSTTVAGLFAAAGQGFPQFYDPSVTDTPADARLVRIVWPAFPASLLGNPRERLEIADGLRPREGDGASGREVQDEYCEWAVERNDDERVTRITFSTEVPEYWEHLLDNDEAGFLALFQEFVGEEPDPSRLRRSDGRYLAANEWNDSTEGRPAHLMQGSNNLEAALNLAAQATILRVGDDGKLVTSPQALVKCGALGEPLRASDPQIAEVVNDAAASGAEITLSDPVGLQIDGLITGGMETPDDEDPAAFWKIERGDAAHTVRASYAVPAEEERGYVVGDITIDGRKIEFGGQLAMRVRVRLDAVAKPGDQEPVRKPCENDQ